MRTGTTDAKNKQGLERQVSPNPVNTAMREYLECQKCSYELDEPAVPKFVGTKCPKCFSYCTIIVERFIL